MSWTAREAIERASHALASDGRVWLVDPLADAAALEAVERLGEVTAVIQLLDRHPRDCAKLAARYGVPHLRLPERVEDSPFEVRRITWVPGWRELGLWWAERRTAVVPEAVGASPHFTVGRGRLGVHPVLRPMPPGGLRSLAPEVLFVGHGRPLHDAAASALREALRRSRRDILRASVAGLRTFGPRGSLAAFRGRGR